MLFVLIENEFPFKEIFSIEIQTEIESIQNIDELYQLLEKMSLNIIEQLESMSLDNNKYVSQAKIFIQENYTRDIGVTDVAECVSISYPYLSKLFKDITNKNIVDYISEVRINNAKILLDNSNLTINQIAIDVGYNNAQSFQRFFKRFTQMTPGEYRKTNLKQNT